ncbi:MAG: hypothetical protein ACK5NK_10440 [Niabella sp.]
MKIKITIFLLIATPIFLLAQSKEELKQKYKNSDLQDEIQKLKTETTYPDSIILPPLHFTNTYYSLKNDIEDFNSISIDIEICNKIPQNYSFYISPFNLRFNNIPMYCGIQSKGGGISSKTGKNEEISFNGIFSRWYERDKNALKTDGYFASAAGEGDFISVREAIGWKKGKYRITLKKDGIIPGNPLPKNINEKDTYFTWGEYEHTWITMTVEDLKSHKTSVIGSLAFPGKNIVLGKKIVSFLEQYNYIIDFAAKPRFANSKNHIYYTDIPYIKVIQKNIRINGKPAAIENVKTLHNNTHNPNQSSINGKMPVLSTDSLDVKKNSVILETGIFNNHKKS